MLMPCAATLGVLLVMSGGTADAVGNVGRLPGVDVGGNPLTGAGSAGGGEPPATLTVLAGVARTDGSLLERITEATAVPTVRATMQTIDANAHGR